VRRVLPFLISFFLIASSLFAQRAATEEAFESGLTALKENRYTDALSAFTTSEREHPEDPRVHNFLGITLTRMGQSAKAAAEYQQAIHLDAGFEDAYRNLGFLEWTDHQLDSAHRALNRAIELSPTDSFAHYYLGRVLLDGHNYADAIHELETSQVELPTNADFSIQLITGYITAGRKEDARRWLDRLAKSNLDDEQSIQIASLLLNVQQNEAAIRILQELAKRHAAAEPSWLKFDLALAYLLAGENEKALAQAHAYQDSLVRGSSESSEALATRTDSWSLVGIADAHLHHNDESVDAFRQAAHASPSEEEEWLNLTRELMELSRYAEAITEVQNSLAANPKSYALHLRLGAAQLSAGHYSEAETAFRQLVVAGDPLSTSYVGLAQVLLRTGRPEEAVAELTEAATRLGPNFLLSYFRGLALDRSGKTLEAIAAFQEAVRLDSSSAEAHLNLAKSELASGRVNDAIAELQEALRLSPGNVQAKRLLSQAYRRVGDAKNAAKFAEATKDVPAGPDADLLGDFFIPHWQFPPRIAKP
jgi:tetratricopeptide (TPR) repeat protein